MYCFKAGVQTWGPLEELATTLCRSPSSEGCFTGALRRYLLKILKCDASGDATISFVIASSFQNGQRSLDPLEGWGSAPEFSLPGSAQLSSTEPTRGDVHAEICWHEGFPHERDRLLAGKALLCSCDLFYVVHAHMFRVVMAV